MHLAAWILYILAAVCQLAGVVLLLGFAFQLRRVLLTGALTRIDAGDARGQRSQRDLSDVVSLLAENQAHPWVGSALVVIGIVAGTVGSCLTL
jgi:hypothetical protein